MGYIINNKADADKYYNIVNDAITKYMNDNKINGKKLKDRFFNSKRFYTSFIRDNDLGDIDNIYNIVKDVIDDRFGIYKDKFNIDECKSFLEYIGESDEFTNNSDMLQNDSIVTNQTDDIVKTYEECIYHNIPDADNTYNNVLADYYDTNLSDITPIDIKKHIYKVVAWNKTYNVIIFSQHDIDTINTNVCNKIVSSFMNKHIGLYNDITITISNYVDDKKLNSDLYSIMKKDNKICEFIAKYLKNGYTFDKVSNDMYIFIKK